MRQSTRRGISPVIATVILVAITIAVAIAVAFWMTGIVSIFAGQVEKLEIVSITPQWGNGQWTITIDVRNTGTTTTTIDSIFINNVLAARENNGNFQIVQQMCGGLTAAIVQQGTLTLDPGGAVRIQLTLANQGQCGATTFARGISLEIKLHSSGGKEYPKLITLP